MCSKKIKIAYTSISWSWSLLVCGSTHRHTQYSAFTV